MLRLEGVYNGHPNGPGFRPEKTPGPAAYSAKVDEKGREWALTAMSDQEQQQSAAFKSETAEGILQAASCRSRPSSALLPALGLATRAYSGSASSRAREACSGTPPSVAEARVPRVVLAAARTRIQPLK